MLWLSIRLMARSAYQHEVIIALPPAVVLVITPALSFIFVSCASLYLFNQFLGLFQQMGNEKNVTRPGGDADSDFEAGSDDSSGSDDDDAKSAEGNADTKVPIKKPNRRMLRQQALRVDSKRVVKKRDQDVPATTAAGADQEGPTIATAPGSPDGTSRSAALAVTDTGRLADIAAADENNHDEPAHHDAAAVTTAYSTAPRAGEGTLDAIEEGDLQDIDDAVDVIEANVHANSMTHIGRHARSGSVGDQDSVATETGSLMGRVRMESTASTVPSVGRLYDPLSLNSPSGLAKTATRRRKIGQPKVVAPS